MLYLGQACKISQAGFDKDKAAIFLGFKQINANLKRASVLIYRDNAVVVDEFPISNVGLIRVKDKNSPTGMSIFRGKSSKGVVNDNVTLHPMKNAVELLSEADAALNSGT